MKRGEERFWVWRRSPIGIGIRRSSDGLWERHGKILPWLWFKGREAGGPQIHSLKIGEYMISAAWLGPARAVSHPEPGAMRSERSERATSLLQAKEGE